MKVVRDILRARGSGTVWSVSPDDSVYSALAMMAERNIGAVLVMQDGKAVGIVSERDYARKVVLKGLVSKQTPVRDIMTSNVLVVNPDRTVDECMALMTDKHIRHLPVLDGAKVVGMISIGDLVKAQIEDRDFVIGQLTDYITGKAR